VEVEIMLKVKACPCCGGVLHWMGKDHTHILGHFPTCGQPVFEIMAELMADLILLKFIQ
jgi:hypothetical protein